MSCLRVMPGSTTQSRSSACTASTRFMSRKSRQMPPCGALTWPSSEVPAPKAMTGTRCGRARAGRSAALLRWSAETPPRRAAGCSIQVSVLPCCSRTACEVTSRLPNERGKSGDHPLDRAAVAFEFLPGFDQYHRGHSLLFCGKVAARAAAGQVRRPALQRHEIRHCAAAPPLWPQTRTEASCSNARIWNPFFPCPSSHR